MRASRGLWILVWGGFLLATALPAQEPLGRVVWTERVGKEFSLHTSLQVPPGTDSSLYHQGVIRLDTDKVLITDKARASSLPGAVDLKDATGDFPGDHPRAKVRFLHPSLDATGKRLLFTGGDVWGPKLSAASADKVEGGTALYFGTFAPDSVFTDPDPGLEFDAFPVADSLGEWIYFSRFHYRPVDGNPPGWYLMRIARTDAEAGNEGNEALLEVGGAPVPGLQPVITSRGSHLIYVRPDPENVGTDLWSLPLDPDPGTPVKLVDGGGLGYAPPTLASTRDEWIEYSSYLGKARIQHPSVSPDGSYVAYACDRDGDWDLFALTLQENASGDLEGLAESRIESFSDQDHTDETWPSVSGDGAFVAYQSNRAGSDANKDADRHPEGLTRIWTAGVDVADGPASWDQLLADPATGTEQMWPYWEQDEDPPHLLLVLQASNGGKPTRLQLIDAEPDSSRQTDHVTMSLELGDYYPEAPPPGSDATPLFPPFQFGYDHTVPPVRIEYAVEDVVSASDDDAGMNPFDPGSKIRRGHSFHLLLSGKRPSLGLHRGLASFTAFDASGTSPGDPGTLKDAAFDGLFLFEDERLLIDVYARDNRWLRVRPTPAVTSLGIYSTDPVEEATQLRVKDPRSLPTGPAEPPYLPIQTPEDLMVRKLPGISWWIEEGAEGETDESKLVTRQENPPFVIFRYANFPPDEVQASQRKDIYLRVVARDLLSNMTDVRIPIHVRDKDFAASRLGSNSRRR